MRVKSSSVVCLVFHRMIENMNGNGDFPHSDSEDLQIMSIL